ncbi:unnamed protein product [Acanthoscelides obtectus]|uniref:Uncharacterized protein n=1 Tax=Acanthoscelides obtectus TaxID=200917 RepID=A0A9P0Q5R2_ACAOB|nr:unnamed protein product [Acanthoscelides obtectus]CAK1640483.1 hypothetical protein AOBTE_LOCUS11752 [Acanthoscelides obtectus]
MIPRKQMAGKATPYAYLLNASMRGSSSDWCTTVDARLDWFQMHGEQSMVVPFTQSAVLDAGSLE